VKAARKVRQKFARRLWQAVRIAVARKRLHGRRKILPGMPFALIAVGIIDTAF
jgi:hypothetical protein